MKTFKHLTYEELIKIETFITEGHTPVTIGIKLARDKSTIYRCIKNYSVDNTFKADVAWEKIQEKRHSYTSHPRILSASILEEFIIEKIKAYWSPSQIAGKWKKEYCEPLSHETIYQFIYNQHPELIKVYLRRKGKKYQANRKEKYHLIDRRMIDERPKIVEEKVHIGHWEGDTIVGAGHKGAILTNTEKKSGFLLARQIERNTSEAVLESTKELFTEIPNEFKLSITYDNGREFAEHKLIEYYTQMTVYFAHAYSPWERGTSENTNGLLRQFFPKGTDLTKINNEELQYYVDLLNDRPRKRHNWLTPREVWEQELMKIAIDSGI